MIWRFLCVLFLFLFSAFIVSGQEIKKYNASRLEGEAPDIDGYLSDSVWAMAEWAGDFTQREPYDNQPPTLQTEFKILYDDNNLYVAIHALDNEPDKIVKRLARRDHFEGDYVAIGIDSYNDKLTGFSFGVNAAGVKIDLRVTNDNDMDDTWNPVWYVKTKIVDDGWVAEMKIPYNQIRFADVEDHVWGLEVMRWLFRKQEFSVWQAVPREASGWVSLWGELHGINNINPKKEYAILPYVMGSLETAEAEEGNPYETGQKWGFNAGVDGKVAVSNDLTLNYTINPDFGQVEADPSEVNLTAYESFFEEKRPFFIEGSNIYNFRLSNGGGGSGRDNLFYSRRIGRRPHYVPELEDDEYMQVADFSRILGALKLSGKTRNGWSIGILESVTNAEMVEIDNNGERRKETAEPITNYFNTRIQKDINKGMTIVGGMVTATNRFINDSTLEFLPTSAYTAGFDFTQYWRDKAYHLTARIAMSYVSGSEESILELQESPRRYYQRPDATHLSVDSTLTSLFGNGGSIEGGKIGEGNWRYGVRVSWRSPGLELNDMGYMRTADLVHESAWLRYQVFKPFSIFRSLNVSIFQWSGFDYSGTNLYTGLRLGGNAEFKNYFTVGTGIRREFDEINRSELRGGPAISYPGNWETWLWGETDSRKKLVGEMRFQYEWADKNTGQAIEASVGLRYRPFDALLLSVAPAYEKKVEQARYVETIELEQENRYVMASLVRHTSVLNLRVEFSLTPDLSIQYWGQPFLFSGDYSGYKVVTDPGNENFDSQFHLFDHNEIWYNEIENQYQVCDPGVQSIDCDPEQNPDYSFENPDFSYYDFRSNLVLRWEYIPGSTVFFVWSQGRTGDDSYGDFDVDRHVQNLLDAKSVNVFLLKFSYRFSF